VSLGFDAGKDQIIRSELRWIVARRNIEENLYLFILLQVLLWPLAVFVGDVLKIPASDDPAQFAQYILSCLPSNPTTRFQPRASVPEPRARRRVADAAARRGK